MTEAIDSSILNGPSLGYRTQCEVRKTETRFNEIKHILQ